MAPVGDVSFELERFEWTADDTLEVVGKWNGLRPGRRLTRPSLTVDTGGRRTRVTGTADLDGDGWRATFDWDGSRGDVAGAELELGRSLVVELPPPRRRRRRRGATAEFALRDQLQELRATVAELTADRNRLLERPRDDEEEATNLREALAASAAARAEAEATRAEAERMAAELSSLRASRPATEELEALRSEAASARAEAERLAGSLREAESRGEANAGVVDELAGLRLAHGSLKAAHERLEDELDELRAIRDERDEAVAQLEALRAEADDEQQQRAALGEIIRELQERTTAAEDARARLEAELAVARADVVRLQGLLAAHAEALTGAEAAAERRIESERAAVTEVHERLASAREEAQQSVAAEAAETERLRAELERTRDDAERLLATERAEVARLREALLNSEVEEPSRRMVERIERELERERASTRTLRRELETLRAETAEHRRGFSNGLPATDESLPPVTPAARTPLGAQRRVAAARANSAARAPRVPPSRTSLWVVRVFAALFIAAVAVVIVIILQAIV